MNQKPTVLTIAGFDPSGCAGILADIKTFEVLDVYGVAVCTANTHQNDVEFTRVRWMNEEEMCAQLCTLQQRFQFQYVKIGLIEHLHALNTLVDELHRHNASVKIVWDPVLKASAGYAFHATIDRSMLELVCKKLFMMTPNLPELAQLLPGADTQTAGNTIAQWCNVLVKGGHSATDEATDILFTKEGSVSFEGKKLSGFDKRGTGCVLSSAIAARLARCDSLVQACRHGKEYVTRFIQSSPTRIGYHAS